jgi:hypothetical protein
LSGAVRHAATSPLAPEAVPAAVARLVEEWGGRWQPGIDGGRLELPVTAGLRRGVLTARLAVRRDPVGSQLSLEVEESVWEVHRSALVILLVGGAGALAVTLWPFFPALLRWAPIGGVLAFVAWFLVVSRLRSSGIDEFLEQLAAPEPPGARESTDPAEA